MDKDYITYYFIKSSKTLDKIINFFLFNIGLELIFFKEYKVDLLEILN